MCPFISATALLPPQSPELPLHHVGRPHDAEVCTGLSCQDSHLYAHSLAHLWKACKPAPSLLLLYFGSSLILPSLLGKHNQSLALELLDLLGSHSHLSLPLPFGLWLSDLSLIMTSLLPWLHLRDYLIALHRPLSHGLFFHIPDDDEITLTSTGNSPFKSLSIADYHH